MRSILGRKPTALKIVSAFADMDLQRTCQQEYTSPQSSVRRHALWLGCLTLLVLLYGLLMPSAAGAEKLTLGGTGSGLGTMQLLAEGFRQADPQFSLVVVPNLGSGGGLKALAAGALDLAVT